MSDQNDIEVITDIPIPPKEMEVSVPVPPSSSPPPPKKKLIIKGHKQLRWFGKIVFIAMVGLASAVVASVLVGIAQNTYGVVPSMRSSWFNTTCTITNHQQQVHKGDRILYEVNYQDKSDYKTNKASIDMLLSAGYHAVPYDPLYSTGSIVK